MLIHNNRQWIIVIIYYLCEYALVNLWVISVVLALCSMSQRRGYRQPTDSFELYNPQNLAHWIRVFCPPPRHRTFILKASSSSLHFLISKNPWITSNMCELRQYDYDCGYRITDKIIYYSEALSDTSCTETITSYFDTTNNKYPAYNYSTSPR